MLAISKGAGCICRPESTVETYLECAASERIRQRGVKGLVGTDLVICFQAGERSSEMRVVCPLPQSPPVPELG